MKTPEPSPIPAIRLLVVDDHPLIRSGIAALIDADAGMRVVAQAVNGREAVDLHRVHSPDVTLMDLQMPVLDGTSAIVQIRQDWPDARIVVLTTYGGDVQALRALKAGACGYLLKTAIRKELLTAIRDAHAGRNHIAPEMSKKLGDHAIDESLSPREIDVLRHLASSSRNKSIAAELGISEGTVKAHMKSILAKLDARDRTDAVVIALRRGIITLSD